MSDEHAVYLCISGEASNHVESFVHEIVKQADDGRRYGVDLDIERVDNPDEEAAEFDTAK